MPAKGRNLDQLQEGINPKAEIADNTQVNFESQYFEIDLRR